MKLSEVCQRTGGTESTASASVTIAACLLKKSPKEVFVTVNIHSTRHHHLFLITGQLLVIQPQLLNQTLRQVIIITFSVQKITKFQT